MRYKLTDHAEKRMKQRVHKDPAIAKLAFEHAVKHGHHMEGRTDNHVLVRYKAWEYVLAASVNEPDTMVIVTVKKLHDY